MMSIGILIPVVLFFGLSVIWGGAISQMAIKSIEGKSQEG